ncbi:hypothetical protein Scep_008868 [Stephania cephalantha]|uniref:Six-bladed beta-propeller, TolB-like protein n=1 Tax=Stephania cephalantha TaxID=152367 RepID=A0AAP0JUH2_9MAGN
MENKVHHVILSLKCNKLFMLLCFIISSAIPLGYILHLERSLSDSTHVYEYVSHGWFRDGAKWDDVDRRFLVSYLEGGVGEIKVGDDGDVAEVEEERTIVKDPDLAGNSSLGLVIDRPRNRLLVVHADVIGNRFGALAAYDLSTWNRVFLTQLCGPGDGKSLADDVAVDGDGSAYVTDAKGSKIWKVGVNGEVISVITSPLFSHKGWYKNLVALNGIVYHPNGFLLVVHTMSGALYKVDTKTGEVKLVKVVGGGSLRLSDGMALVSDREVAVAGLTSGRMVESRDDWETAEVVGSYRGPAHRLATAATVKDGKVYLGYMFGSYEFHKRKHVIAQAVFSEKMSGAR